MLSNLKPYSIIQQGIMVIMVHISEIEFEGQNMWDEGQWDIDLFPEFDSLWLVITNARF